MQAAITEALCRMTPKKLREELVGKWFGYRSFASSFTTISVKEFETVGLCSIDLRLNQKTSNIFFRIYQISNIIGVITINVLKGL